MKTVILAGGFGTRISEETATTPKPMIEIGGHPLLWHIMKLYSHYGHNEFIICLGYKGYVIKEYFANYLLHRSDVTLELQTNKMEFHSRRAEPWTVTLVDTGIDTMTGGRLKRVQAYVGESDFFMTYGDGLANVHLDELLRFHQSEGTLATMTAVSPPGRFGAIERKGHRVASFREKPDNGSLINGGFFVLSAGVFDYLSGDDMPFERKPLERLAADAELAAFEHNGFWQPVDTLRDKRTLEELARRGETPWQP